MLFGVAILQLSCETKIDSVEKAKEYAIGIWTGSEEVMAGYVSWSKYVIKGDGTFDAYSAAANADSWGSPLFSGTWEAGTAKYTDTGDRYYYLSFAWNGNRIGYPIVDGNIVVKYLGGDSGPILSKGDRNPFK